MDIHKLKIAVIGPGAVGCLLAHGLSLCGCNVTLIDHRPERAQRLSSTGITVITPEGHEQSRLLCLADTNRAGVQDAVIFAVKAYQTKDAAVNTVPMVGQNTLVVTLQNGMGYEKYLKAIAAQGYLVTGVTALGATLMQDGRVRLAGTGKTIMGFTQRPDGKGQQIFDLLKSAFLKAGWEFEQVEDPESARWQKLMVNVGINAITAITCIKNGEILHYQHALDLQDSAVREAFSVMQHHCGKASHNLDSIMENVRDVCRRTADNISSMLQDRLKHGVTEIEYINGFICRAGDTCGIETPVNRTLCRLIRVLEASGWKTAP